MPSASISITSPGCSHRLSSRPEPPAAVPEPSTSPGRRVRSRDAYSIIDAKVWCMFAVVSDPHTSPFDSYCQAQVRRVDLVGGDDARAEHVGPVPVLGFAGPHTHWQLLALHISSGDVVPDRVPEDVLGYLCCGNVPALPADDNGQLELVIKLGAVGRPRDLLLGSDDGVGQSFVVGRHLVPLGGNLPTEVPVCILQVSLEGEKVTKSPWTKRGTQPAILDEGKSAHRRAGRNERDHIAVEVGVENLVTAEHADAEACSAFISDVLHSLSLYSLSLFR